MPPRITYRVTLGVVQLDAVDALHITMCAGELNRAAFLRRRMERPRLADMAEDFGVLAAELERCFGEAGGVPAEPLAAPGGHARHRAAGGGDAAGA